jgi:hypothetical protein
MSGIASAAINLTGENTLTLSNADSQVSVNLLHGARWDGTLNMGGRPGPETGLTTVNGGPDARWNNNGHSVIDNTETAEVNVPVIGTGTFNINAADANGLRGATAKMEFASSVGAHQSITDSGILVLDKPKEFAGHVTLAAPVGGLSLPEIDLNGLANADSYTFKNDMLSIFSGNSVIDRMRLTNQVAHGFFVDKAANGTISITGITDPTHIPIALFDHLLPLHV